jgi:predicted permease
MSTNHAVRSLRRHPGFTAAAVLTLALGLGATTAIFGVVYGVLLKPLPYPDPDELVSIWHTAPGNPYGVSADTLLGSADSMYFTYREENRTFEHMGLWGANEATLTNMGEAERIRRVVVTHGTLQALGVQPLLGRWFTEAEHTPAAEGTESVILSYAFWQRRFGGEESALGRPLTLDARPSQVVGVMPAGFRFPSLLQQPDVIVATRIDRAGIPLGNLNSPGIARLKDGVTLAEANADVARMLSIWLDAWPPGRASREAVADWRVTPALRPLKADVVGGVGGTLWLLMGAVGAVLLIACANIANLLLARADTRRQELAIRAALGAGQRRIAGELLREAFVLGAVGGAVGLALAFAGLELLAAFAPANLPRVEDIAVGPAALAFAVAAALLSSLLFGSIPAVKHALATERSPRAGARGASTSPVRNRARSALIVVQVALALVLLVGAGLMIRTFQALTAIEPGFTDPQHVQVASMFIPPWSIPGQERAWRMQREVLERIAALPGVTEAAIGGAEVVGQGAGRLGPPGGIFVEGRPDVAVESLPTPNAASISPGYFDALGTRIVAGRDLTWADVDDNRPVVLVSENLARALWGEPQAALGKRIRSETRYGGPGPWREIIGITQDVYTALYERPPVNVYSPIQPSGLRATGYVIRSERAGTESFVTEVRRAVAASHPDLTLVRARTLQDIYSEALAPTSFMLVLLAIAGSMALVLSVVGLYGVISYVVSQRTREIGIRVALGAEAGAVRRMFVRYGLGVATIGVAAGLAGAAGFSRFLASLLFDVRPLDLGTYVAAVGLLLAAAMLAAYVPARRAAKLDPAATLRAE